MPRKTDLPPPGKGTGAHRQRRDCAEYVPGAPLSSVSRTLSAKAPYICRPLFDIARHPDTDLRASFGAPSLSSRASDPTEPQYPAVHSPCNDRKCGISIPRRNKRHPSSAGMNVNVQPEHLHRVLLPATQTTLLPARKHRSDTYFFP